MYNLLIVDDESIICEGLSRIINWNEHNFCVVGFASNGQEAIEKIRNYSVDIVMADIRMPVMDGIELSRQIRQYNPKIHIIIISGYSDFQYAKKAIEYGVKAYLLKPVIPNELMDEVIKIKHQLDEQSVFEIEKCEKSRILNDKTLYDIVNGHTNIKHTREELKKHNIYISGDTYTIVLISINDSTSMCYQDIEHVKSVRSGVRGVIEDIVREKRLGCVYEDIGGVFGIIISFDCGEDRKQNEIYMSLESIVHRIEKDCGVESTIGYGLYRTDFNEIKTCREEAFRALDRKIINRGECIFSYASYIVEENRLCDIKWAKDDLIKAIEVIDEELIKKQVNLLIEEIISNGISRDVIKIIIVDIILEISALIKNYGGDAYQIFDHTEFSHIDRICDDVKNIHGWVAQICEKCRRYIADLKLKKSKRLIDYIIEYVDDHYCDDINLSLVADRFYINTAYLGQLFKENAGMSFSQYINRKKINLVKQLCIMSDFKIYEIIEKAGFKNSEYFYRQFKRYEGITFAEFRDNLTK